MRYKLAISFKDWSTKPLVVDCKTIADLKEWVGMIDNTVENAYYDDNANNQRVWLVESGAPVHLRKRHLIQCEFDHAAAERMRKSLTQLIR